MMKLRSPLLSSTVKSLELNGNAPMPTEQQEIEREKRDTKDMILSWQRAQKRMRLYAVERMDRNE